MGLIQVPRGIQTKRGYAPADIARSAAESAAPWAWRGLQAAAIAWRGGLIDLSASRLSGPTLAVDSGTFSLTARGRGFSPGKARLKTDLQDRDRVTLFALVHLDSTPAGNENILGQIDSENDGWSLLSDDSEFVSGNTDCIAMRPNIGGTDRGSIAGPNGSASPGWHSIVVTFDNAGSGIMTRLFDNGPLLASASDSSQQFADSATIGTIAEADTFIGLTDQGFLNTTPLSGSVVIAGAITRTLSEPEAAELSFDLFAPFRRRPILVPVSSGGGATGVSWSEAVSGSDTFAALVTALGTVTEPASAGDTASAIATVGTSLTEAVSAQDSDAGPAQALGDITAAATGSDLVDAVAQASAAITAGAAAGESWVAQAQAVADLVEAGTAGDTLTQASTSAQQAAIDEGSTAGDTFAAAVQSIASLTESASAADALIATVVAMGSITESAQAGDTFTAASTEAASRSITQAASASDSNTAVAQILAALTEAIDAASVYAASASVTAAITASAQAGDSWSAVVPGTGYLVASAITITAALSGSTSIDPALSGTAQIKPD